MPLWTEKSKENIINVRRYPNGKTNILVIPVWSPLYVCCLLSNKRLIFNCNSKWGVVVISSVISSMGLIQPSNDRSNNLVFDLQLLAS